MAPLSTAAAPRRSMAKALAALATAANRPATRANSSASSISALAYKTLHRGSKQPPLPTIETPSWSTNAAISSILYETPNVASTNAAAKPHVLNCLVQNEPGVLSRISGTLAARGFNIDSLVVSNTEVKDLSRMTIVLQGLDGVIEQARRQIEDLVPVWAVLDYTHAPLVARELLLARVSLLGPEYFEELLHHHGQIYKRAAPGAASPAAPGRKFFHPANLAPSEALRHKHEHLRNITSLAHQFGGKVADISDRNCIVELCAKPDRITSFISLLQPFGILELARSGMTALPRTPLDSAGSDEGVKDADEIVDATQLPPG
ncbi:uncharacterized protein SAPINGB_P002688 [Magnusiomyces paraingens]|uniref:ACT domain-containing protein n=1 Tax=Magnusiomyces paraingens TaxID=2606893 RepID=A0A5E8BF83_9ASCO|nr:uncharacterized protein SAPINGB_P002688 [Saprochaete ingens]VVT50276.1 unnamed protein product [Saprochaete ingens]